MSWEIVYSDQARQDLRSIYDEYIAFSLLERRLRYAGFGNSVQGQ